MVRYAAEVRSRAVEMVLDGGRDVKAVAAELGVPASTMHKWVRTGRCQRRGQWWAQQVAPVFDFLAGYGFALVDVQAGDWWEIRALYRAERAALIVVYSREFRRVEVRLIRSAPLDLPDLSNGRVFLFGVPGLHGHLADGLLQRRQPNGKPHLEIVQAHVGLEPDRVASALRFWADVVREDAADFLHGDLSLLEQWEHQPGRLRVTVNVPRTATPREQARAVERTRAVLPDADVVVEQYPRPLFD